MAADAGEQLEVGRADVRLLRVVEAERGARRVVLVDGQRHHHRPHLVAEVRHGAQVGAVVAREAGPAREAGLPHQALRVGHAVDGAGLEADGRHRAHGAAPVVHEGGGRGAGRARQDRDRRAGGLLVGDGLGERGAELGGEAGLEAARALRQVVADGAGEGLEGAPLLGVERRGAFEVQDRHDVVALEDGQRELHRVAVGADLAVLGVRARVGDVDGVLRAFDAGDHAVLGHGGVVGDGRVVAGGDAHPAVGVDDGDRDVALPVLVEDQRERAEDVPPVLGQFG